MNFVSKWLKSLNQVPQMPWEFNEEDEKTNVVKQEILNLYKNPNLFIQKEEKEYAFEFNLLEYVEIANHIVQLDPNLGKLRKSIVPQKVMDEIFWENYFYNVELIKLKNGMNNKICELKVKDNDNDIEI